MTAKQLFDEIKNGAMQNGAYIFYGPEEVFKQRLVDALKDSIPLSEFNCASLYAPSTDDIMQACEALPVMSDKRLVLVYESALFKKPKTQEGEQSTKGSGESKALATYLADINPTTCLVFIGKDKPSGVSAAVKAITKADKLIAFEPFSQEQAAHFAVDLAAKTGNVLSLDCARKLVFMAGVDLTVVSAQTQKVCDFAGTQAVTMQMVNQVVAKNLEYTVFEMLEHFLAGRLDEAFLLLHDTVRDNVGESIKLIGFFASRIRHMYTARKGLDAGFAEQKIIGLIGGSPYAAKMSIKAARAFTTPQVENQILALAQADLDAKTGKAPAHHALELALVKMFG